MLWYEMERNYRTEQKDDNVNLHSGWSKPLDEIDRIEIRSTIM